MAKKESKKKMRNIERILLYSVILILLILVIILLFHNSFSSYHSFKNHENYFRNNQNITIQSWMTIRTIERHFNINETILLKEINITSTDVDLRKPLDQICAEHHIDCNILTTRLNSLVK